MTSGARIKSFRNQKRIRQKELANHLHASFQTISKWENDENEPDVSSLIELSKVFGCSLDALVGENEEQEKKEDKSEETKEDESSKQEGDAPAPQTIIIHQKEMHVCEKCKKRHSGRRARDVPNLHLPRSKGAFGDLSPSLSS